MTEEIIINCAFYKDGVCASPINKTCEYCKNIDVSKCYHKQLKRLEQELKVEKQDKKYIKECCIRAGKELSKHSFEWDGKEKNLVVQAMQLNEDYERLEQERDELKKACEKCKLFDIEKTNRNLLERIEKLEQENKSLYEEKNCLHKIIDRLLENAGYSKDIASAEDFEDVYEDMQIKQNKLNNYRSALEEINLILDELKQQYDYMTDYSEIKEIQDKINEVLE